MRFLQVEQGSGVGFVASGDMGDSVSSGYHGKNTHSEARK